MIEEGCLFGLVLLTAIFFHTVADLFTVKGVSVLWPDTTLWVRTQKMAF